jgi:hypothetical protein
MSREIFRRYVREGVPSRLELYAGLGIILWLALALA